MLATALLRRLGRDMISMPSHAGDGATMPSHDIDAMSMLTHAMDGAVKSC
jgi:hypothetical protein